MESTLKNHLITAEGTFLYRGTVIDSEKLDPKFRNDKYLLKGAVPIEKVTRIDEVEIKDFDFGEEQGSPMKEFAPKKK
jgi:hypothetical protein